MRIIGNDPSTPRQAQIVASGTLSTGDAVVVNSDGTVSVVEGVSIAGATGSPVVFESAESEYITVTYDESNSKVVVAYKDGGNSNYGTAVVGTISGTSISFGTPVVFNSTSSTFISATYDANSGKVVIAFSNNANQGTAIVGTVSGTSISFGSTVTFSSASVKHACAYDSSNQKVVIAYRNNSNTQGDAIVGTVSGTSISFGSSATFDSNSSNEISIGYDSINEKVVVSYEASSSTTNSVVGTVSGTSISFGSVATVSSVANDWTITTVDTVSGKVVVFYNDKSSSSRATAAVGTISGTSISFGSPVVADPITNVGSASAVMDTAAQKVVLSYDATSNYLNMVSGTVNGTSITFDTPVVINSQNSQVISSVYSPDDSLIVNAYKNNSTNHGTSVLRRVPVNTTNLTSENYIGTAASPAADTQRAKINLKGAVDENQSGLTAGQSYYVQTDGTLGTTPADPSVFAGTAVAATKLIVKG